MTDTDAENEIDTVIRDGEMENVSLVRPLIEEHRAKSGDYEITDHDETNSYDYDPESNAPNQRYGWERGDKLKEVIKADPSGGSRTDHINLTKLLTPGISTTTSTEILLIEAELATDGEVGNPHLPANDRTYRAAMDLIDQHGLVPAWERV